MTKLGRNDPCLCGSGKKYKQCCLRNAPAAADASQPAAIAAVQAAIDSHVGGRLPDAEMHYRRAIKILSQKHDLAMAHNSLGVVLKQQAKFDEAATQFRKAISLKPDFAEVYGNLANVLLEKHSPEDAVACFQKALSIKPDFAEAYSGLGKVLLKQGRREDAIACFKRALSIAPLDADSHCNLGDAYYLQGNFDAAMDGYRNAISLKPDLEKAHCMLSELYWKKGMLEDALSSGHRAISLKPDDEVAHNNLGLIFDTQGRLTEACASFRNALAIRPDLAETHNNLGKALHGLGMCAEAIASYRKSLAIEPGNLDVYSNLLHSHTVEFADLPETLALARDWERAFVSASGRHIARDRVFKKVSLAGRRLKVGYVSPDFRQHAVAFFIEPILANHDKNQFEVFCYYNHTQHDDFTNRLTGYADHWLNCDKLSDGQLVEQIRAEGIDILVDLAGHSVFNRMKTFALKPAPIQITYLGYPSTSGIAAMDYRLTDGCADPPGCEAYYTETLLRLPDSLCCYRPSHEMPEITALPALDNGYVTFGSFNNFNKINDACIALWARVLQTVPASRLMMLTVPEGPSRQRLIEQFGALGVTEDRLKFHGKLAQSDFFRACQCADIALDPIAVTGGTTTCETLWLGMPVVVLVGERFITRVGYSFLNAAGLGEFAAENADHYVRIAADLARDLPRLAELRAGMRDRMARSALTDDVKFTRNLEKIYLEIWEKWYNTAS